MDAAPPFTIEHLKGQTISLGAFSGRKVVVIFAGKDTDSQAKQIATSIRQRFGHEQLPIIGIMDAHNIPKLVRPVAKTFLKKAYDDAVEDQIKELQAKGQPIPGDMSTIIMMAADFDGKIIEAYGAQGAGDQAIAVLVDEHGNIAARFIGPAAGQQIVATLG